MNPWTPTKTTPPDADDEADRRSEPIASVVRSRRLGFRLGTHVLSRAARVTLVGDGGREQIG